MTSSGSKDSGVQTHRGANRNLHCFFERKLVSWESVVLLVLYGVVVTSWRLRSENLKSESTGIITFTPHAAGLFVSHPVLNLEGF